MEKSIFFTGGSGFVGQNMIPILKKQGYHIFALSRSEKAAQKVEAVGATPVMDNLLSLSSNTQKATSTIRYSSAFGCIYGL